MRDWAAPQPASRFASVDGVDLHYQVSGSGPVVLLLHGSGSSLQGVEKVAGLLSSDFTVVRPDLPGAGLTGPRSDRDYRIGTYARTVADFMTALGPPSYAIVGNSLGGNIAWNLALDFPERIDALVLVNATGYPGKSLPAGLRLARNPLVRPLMRRWLPRAATEKTLRSVVGENSAVVDDAMVDRVHGLMSLPGNRSAFVDLANTDQGDRSAEIVGIAAPTLVLRSAGMAGQHFARDIQGARERVHATAGHLLPEEDPAWVAREIATFLQDLAGRGPRLGERP